MQMHVNETIAMRLTGVRDAARDTKVYEFEGVDNDVLPAATAGAHIDLHLPNGIVRSYSLLESGEMLSRYTVGVKREPASRGGSSFLHDSIRVGDVIRVGTPRNNFPLDEAAGHSVLIGGGIGITPILCMAKRLAQLGRPFELHYACRDREDVLSETGVESLETLRIHLDAEAGCVMDIGRIVSEAPPRSHFYCCGPAPMLNAYEKATEGVPRERVHLERFGAAAPIVLEGGFTVVLQDLGEEFFIPEGKSILEVLRDAGHDLAYSCEAGICGSCQMRVIEGEPDHQDMVLSDEEKAANTTMMICCSGSKSERLVLASI